MVDDVTKFCPKTLFSNVVSVDVVKFRSVNKIFKIMFIELLFHPTCTALSLVLFCFVQLKSADMLRRNCNTVIVSYIVWFPPVFESKKEINHFLHDGKVHDNSQSLF